jgi:hypothetical protein
LNAARPHKSPKKSRWSISSLKLIQFLEILAAFDEFILNILSTLVILSVFPIVDLAVVTNSLYIRNENVCSNVIISSV